MWKSIVHITFHITTFYYKNKATKKGVILARPLSGHNYIIEGVLLRKRNQEDYLGAPRPGAIQCKNCIQDCTVFNSHSGKSIEYNVA